MGENGLLPCAQDGFEGMGAMTDLKKPLVWNPFTMTCDTTGYTMSTETFWVLWGHPMDTYELTKRTGSAPVVTFPLVRGPYPSYSTDSHGDDAMDLYPKIKEWLVYLGAFSASELDGYDVEPSEGAEQGVVAQIGAMAAYIAKQTCNRDIYILSEAPSYGYSLSTAAKWAEKLGGFKEGCSSGDTISISMIGWLPGTPFPTAVGADNITYSADSTSPNSPWMESLVFPENPSGVIKTPQLPANRRVCDACYIYPMCFGQGSADTSTWHIPDAPDCMSWAGSVTKVYSASVRAGYVIYKNDDAEWAGLMKSVMDDVRGMPDGLMSEWTWWGQIQILDQMMAKPYSSPESWIGAYVQLMHEKWTYLIDGFSGCSNYITITNPYMGAYGWFKLEGDAVGKESGSYSSFFGEVLGVKTTTYRWGFRGSNPADYYGAAYGTNDFVRLQLFRDVHVYKEIGRRAALVCSDTSKSVDGYLTIDGWLASRRRRRALKEGAAFDHSAHVRAIAPHLAEHQIEKLSKQMAADDAAGAAIEQHCAPSYTTDCLMKYMSESPVVKPNRKKSRSLRQLTAARSTMPTGTASSSAVALTKRQRRLAPSSHRNLAENDYYSEAGDCIRKIFKATPYEVCPAESFYWGERRAQPARASPSTPTRKALSYARTRRVAASAPRRLPHPPAHTKLTV